MWPFKRKPFLDAETADWHIENFEWLVACFAQYKCLTQAQLVLPLPGYFPNDGETGHALAERIFLQVKSYALIDWPVKLVQDPANHKPSRSMFAVVEARSVLGTFQASTDNIPEISYAANLIDNPVSLVATFAHEVGHLIVHSAPSAPICDDDELEFLTDLAAVYLGFGIFLANSSFSSEQWRDDATGTQGWRTQRQGYLPEADLVFATALFVMVKGLDPSEAKSCLKPHLAKCFDAALLDLKDRQTDINRIAALEATYP
jgi:hypothetical protein